VDIEAELTWHPAGSCEPEILQVRLPQVLLDEFNALIGTEEWRNATSIVWVDVRQKDGSYKKSPYRIFRITSVKQTERA